MLQVSPAPVRKVKKGSVTGSNGQNIKVFVRVRPLNESEKNAKAHCLVECPTSKEVVVQERPFDKYTKKFSFDRVFDKQSKQTDIYKVVAKPLVEEVLNGFNCTIFAYGQTGTGKTFTMEGDHCPAGVRMEENMGAGIIPRCVNQLFDELRIQQLEFNMRVSFLELYNEELFDILSAHDDLSKLRMYEDAGRKGSCIVQGLEEVVVRNKSDVYNIIEKGSSKRQTAATLMNAHSSRSHTVFTVTVHIKENTLEGDELLKTGKLHLVDLAGSENIGRSGAVDKRAREAGNINQSLLTLGRVITSLVEKAPHVPYRESKLTRLLQDALGGRTKTSIIATISPASHNLEETVSTLDYAHRAKNIQNKPEVNQKLNKKELICEYTNEIEKLRRDLLAMREKNGVYLANENYQEMILTMEQQSKEIMEKISLIRGLESEMETHIELFTVVSQELKDTSEKLSSTESKLSKTKEVLQCTQKLLSQTAVERDEQKHLVGAHVKTEGELHTQGRDLVDVAKTTTSDISKLHDKLDRKRKVEVLNEETEKTFTREFEERVQAMHSSVYAFKEHHHRNSTGVVEELGVCTSSTLKKLEGLSENLKFVNSLMLDSLEKGSSFFDKKVDKCVGGQSAVCDSVQKQALGEETLLKQFIGEVFCPLIQKMVGHLSQHHSSIQAVKSSLLSKITSMSESWSSVYGEQCSLLAAMEEHLGDLIELPPRLQQELCHKSDFLQESTRAHSEVLKKLLQTISEQIDQHSSSVTSQLPLLTSKQTEDLSNAHHVSKKMLEDVSTLTNLSSDHNAKTIQHKEDVVELLTAGVEKMEMETKDMEGNTFDLKEEVERQVSESSSAFCDVARASQEAKEEVTRKGKACKKEFKKEIQGVCSDVTAQFESCEQETEGVRGLVQSSISRVQEDLNRFESELEEFLVDHNDQLRETGDSVPALFKEQIIKDIPTGVTPNRREYPFSQNLSATSPHERILNRYRLKMNSGSRIPLPIFNHEGEDELVSSDQDSMPPSCNSSLESEGEKDSSGGFALPLSRSTSFNKDGQSIFAFPAAPVRQESKEELSSSKQNSLSRSSSASSLTDSKENLPINNSRKNPSQKKREIKPPSANVNSEKLGVDAPTTRARRVLGNCN